MTEPGRALAGLGEQVSRTTNRLVDEVLGNVTGQALAHRSFCESFGEKEDVGRSGAGHGGHGIHHVLLHDPHRANRTQDFPGDIEVVGPSVATRGQTGDTLANQSGGVGHGPDDGNRPELSLVGRSCDTRRERHHDLSLAHLPGDSLQDAGDITGFDGDDYDIATIDGLDRIEKDPTPGLVGQLVGPVHASHTERDLRGLPSGAEQPRDQGLPHSSDTDDCNRGSFRHPEDSRNGVTFASMDLRAAARERDELLNRRLDAIVPRLMNQHGFEAWVIDAREYNEDPVAQTMLPATWWETARRRTMLVFKDHGNERGAIARYPVGPFPPVWNPEEEPDQWAALGSYLSDVTGRIGINTSGDFALADGLSSSEHFFLATALDSHRLGSAENLAIGWLETRLIDEVAAMAEACSIAHGFLRRALSPEVIVPGTTTTQDVAWWLAQIAHDAGHGIWFHPGVTVQRRGDGEASPADGISDRAIESGDLVHIDFGIVRNGYHTDQQQHGYVLAEGETRPPESFVRGLSDGNRLQDILMEKMTPGSSGNDVLAATIEQARTEGIRPIVYTHPIGLHGHAAGSTVGLWDNQTAVPGAGDYPIGVDTAWSIELAVEIEVDEWDGQPAKIMLEEDAFLDETGTRFLDGRQEELWLIG